jgi:GNAT superfamily N-acetyltransferase
MSRVESTAGIRIRLRDQADITGCIDVLRAVHDADGYPARWPTQRVAFLRPKGLVAAWIALSGPAIIGHVALGAPDELLAESLGSQQTAPVPEKIEVKRLFVGPTARGKGVARTLLGAATQCARALRSLPVLEVTMDGIAAIRLYESTGWRRTGTKVATWADASGAHPHLYTYEWRA